MFDYIDDEGCQKINVYATQSVVYTHPHQVFEEPLSIRRL